MASEKTSKGPLSGLKVLDVTQMLAGPYCTWMMGMMGAEVIKVERPDGGDFARAVAPFREEESLYFMSVNRNKRSLTLNLKSDEGKQIFRELLADCDILVENNRAGVMDRLGLGYADASKINPRLIYASISGYGQTGPYKNKPAFDVVAQAISGMMSITGESDGPPARVGVSIGDIASGLFCAVSVLAALEGRHKSGQGTFIDVSMMDCQLALMENAVSRYMNTGDIPRRLGSRHPLIAPFQAIDTADLPIAICVDTEPQWERMCHAMKLEPLMDDPRFEHGSMRAENHADLEPLLKARFAERTRDEWLSILEAADVPCSPINSIPEVVNDPQVAHRGILVEVPPKSGIHYVGSPFHMLDVDLRSEGVPPRLGEHSGEILKELGRSEETVETLRGQKVI
ncbi:CoA:oxalate CoA-transferase [Paraburkholderia fungorum]|uniref:CoA:oxalate CoA-transferase n=1 Tax=Paraburkholderia fungorum TaxID=134537 RepID=A0A1H1JV57_9BURK|nr:CoA transferase [Paraburkholderia fungorum]SDR53888.1 CoA:oxalate CoA-transferase [Paraburkholderia fungorum]